MSPCLVASGVALLVCGGCVAPNPASLPATERDNLIYQDQGATQQKKEEKSRVAIIVSQGDYKEAAGAAKALDSTLTSLISEFAFFQVAERSNLGALMQEGALAALNEDGDTLPSIPDADYLITASLNAFQIVERLSTSLLTTSLLAAPNDRGNVRTVADVYVSVDFRFYEMDSKRVILTRNIEKKYPGEDVSSARSKAAIAAQECAKAFAMDLGERFAPPARVVETRGKGKVARISMGTNYGAAKGAKVEFFEYVDNSDVVAGATRDMSLVARGIVLESDQKNAWVEIENYKEANVKRGHYVKIRGDQSKGLRDRFRVEF